MDQYNEHQFFGVKDVFFLCRNINTWHIILRQILGGGNSNMFYFHPENWGRWTHFDEHILQKGWNHQMAGSKNLVNLVVSECFPSQSQQFKDGGS